MNNIAQAAETTAESIYKWVRLSTPEQLERDGMRYIMIRLLDMMTASDLAERQDLEYAKQQLDKCEKQLVELNAKMQILEDQIGV